MQLQYFAETDFPDLDVASAPRVGSCDVAGKLVVNLHSQEEAAGLNIQNASIHPGLSQLLQSSFPLPITA